MSVEYLSLLLLKYLGLSGKVVIPGIGLLDRIHYAAQNQFVDKFYAPPAAKISFNRSIEVIPEGQLRYLSRVSGSSSDEIMEQLEHLGKRIFSMLETDRKVEWIGLGHFQMDDEGFLSFQQRNLPNHYYRDIPYSHVVRKNVEHSITVGSSEKTTHEMEEYFEEQRNLGKWKFWEKMALVVFLLSIIIIGIRFFMGNFELLSPTYQKLNPAFPSATHMSL